MLTVAWSLYDEFYGLRPWRDYQSRFAERRIRISRQSSQQPEERRSRRLLRPPNTKLSPRKLTSCRKPPRRRTNKSPSRSIFSTNSAPPSAMLSRTLAERSATSPISTRPLPNPIRAPRPKPERSERWPSQQIWNVDWPLGDGKVEQRQSLHRRRAERHLHRASWPSVPLSLQSAPKSTSPRRTASDALALYVNEHLPGLSSASLESLQHSMKDFDQFASSRSTSILRARPSTISAAPDSSIAASPATSAPTRGTFPSR